MQSTSMKTLRSRQRFPDDPQALVALTEQQMELYESIQHSMRRFMNHFSLATNSYHQLMDNLLKCLDLSWESTSTFDTTIAGIISSVKQCQEFFSEKVVTPVNEQVGKHKMLRNELHRWNKQSKKLDHRLKSLEKVQTKSKTESKLEKAKYRVEDAASTCYEDATSLRPALEQINTDGVQACCRTWILMSQCFSKMNESLGDLFIELSSNAKRLERQALTGSLPAWTESNNRASRLRVSTLGNLGGSMDSGLGSLHSISGAMNTSIRKSSYECSTFNDYSSLDNLVQKHFVPRSKSLMIDHYRRQYKPNNRLSRTSSTKLIRANSVSENASTYESDADMQRNSVGTDRTILRSKSSDSPYGLNTIHESGARDSVLTESAHSPSPVLRNAATSGVPMIRNSLVTNQSARSSMTEFKSDSPTQRLTTITYESQEQEMQTRTAESQNKDDQMNEGVEETTEKRTSSDNEEEEARI